METSTPCKIVTRKNFILKLCKRDYVGEITRHANFGFNRYSGASPQGEILPPLTVLSCPYLFSRSYAQAEPLDRFSRFTAQITYFRARMVLLGVRTMDDHIWEKYAPKTAKNGRE